MTCLKFSLSQITHVCKDYITLYVSDGSQFHIIVLYNSTVNNAIYLNPLQ